MPSPYFAQMSASPTFSGFYDENAVFKEAKLCGSAGFAKTWMYLRNMRGWDLGMRLRRFVLVVLSVIVVDWFSSLLARHFLFASIILNPTPPPTVLLLFLTAGFGAIVVVFRARTLIVGAGLCYGGALANILAFAAFGPVVDFIPEPIRSGGWQCNPADLCVWGGSVVVAVAMLALLFGYYRRHRSPSITKVDSVPA